jgi:hypothetical protein
MPPLSSPEELYEQLYCSDLELHRRMEAVEGLLGTLSSPTESTTAEVIATLREEIAWVECTLRQVKAIDIFGDSANKLVKDAMEGNLHAFQYVLQDRLSKLEARTPLQETDVVDTCKYSHIFLTT